MTDLIVTAGIIILSILGVAVMATIACHLHRRYRLNKAHTQHRDGIEYAFWQIIICRRSVSDVAKDSDRYSFTHGAFEAGVLYGCRAVERLTYQEHTNEAPR